MRKLIKINISVNHPSQMGRNHTYGDTQYDSTSKNPEQQKQIEPS